MTRTTELAMNVATGVIAACTVLMSAVVLKRELFDPPPGSAAPAVAPSRVDNWQQVTGQGRRIGPAGALVTIVEFSDFQCPFCRRFALGPLKSLRQRFPNDVAVLYRHWPLTSHKFAYAAARAAECAAVQGRFEQFHDLLFTQQDSIPTKPLRRFAKESGVADLAAFDRCNEESAPVPTIEADIAEARRLGARGTPWLLVNGYLLHTGGDSAAIDSVVHSFLRKPKVR